MGAWRSLVGVAAVALFACACTFMTGGGVDDGGLSPAPEERIPRPADPDDGDDGDEGDGGAEDGGDAPDGPEPVVPPPDDPAPDEPTEPEPDPGTCNPPCGAGQECRDGACVAVSESDDAQQLCVDLTNRYRAEHGRSPVARSPELEECATEGAEYDSGSFFPHAHFSRTGGCGGVADAENECPGWSGDVLTVVRDCLAMMMDEGPGGGHYENILGSHEGVGCGIHVTARGAVWVVQDFR